MLERQLLIASNDDRARNRRQVVRLSTLLVILHEFVDLSPDDLTLIGLLARRDPPFEQIPVHLRWGFLLSTPDRLLARLAVIQHLEANELVDVFSGESRL